MSNGIYGDNFVKKSGITKQEFEAQLNSQGLSEETKQKAMSIFNQYANADASGIADTLDVSEQEMAKADLDKLDKDKKDGVTEEEFNANKNEVEKLKDKEFGIYKAFSNVLNAFKPEEKEKPADTKEKAATGTKTFADKDAAKKAIYQYLAGSDKTTLKEEDIARLNDLNVLKDITIQDIAEGGDDKVKLTYKNKTFIMQKTGDTYTINSEKKDDESEVSLQQEILNSETTDIKHNYLNKYGKAGNNKSVYNTGNGHIDNTSKNRQHVNPVQTFTSMILNNTEDSSLTIAQGLKGQDIIDVVKGENETEISMSELLKYLKAAVDEAQKTTNEHKNFGTRTAASDVDMDLKDLANLGAVFKKYDKDSSGSLNASELDELIKDLTTKGNSMTKLAKSTVSQSQQQETLKKPDKKTNPKVKENPDFKLGDDLKANRTRNIAGTGKQEQIEYHYDGGRRTIVQNGKAVTNANIAEYEDHGLLGAGKKDFVVIFGLGADVRAEVLGGKPGEDMVVKVKDKKGKTTYHNVTYDKTKKTYNLDNKDIGKKAAKAKTKSSEKSTKQAKPTKPVKPSASVETDKQADKTQEETDYSKYTDKQWNDYAAKTVKSKSPENMREFIANYKTVHPNMSEQEIANKFKFPKPNRPEGGR